MKMESYVLLWGPLSAQNGHLFVRDILFLDIREQEGNNDGIKYSLYTIGSLDRTLYSSTRRSLGLPSCPESKEGTRPLAQNINRQVKILYIQTDKHQTESMISNIIDIIMHFGFRSPRSPTPSLFNCCNKVFTPNFVPSKVNAKICEKSITSPK